MVVYVTIEDEKVVELIKENQALRIENKELKHRLDVYENYIEVKNGKSTERNDNKRN